MFKISEFAKLAKTTRRTLIFYDEKELFSAAKIADNGYRYYEPDQLYQFELISTLRQLGLSLNNIKVVISSSSEKLDQYLTYYQQKNQEQIRHLQLLNRMLEMRRNRQPSYEKVDEGIVKVIPVLEQEFWCTDLEANCTPDDVARLYSKFMNDLGDITSQIPSQLVFLTNLPLKKGQEYMSAAFRFIKETTIMDSRSLMTRIVRPASKYLSIKVNTSLGGILQGLKKMKDYADANNLKTTDVLWQINVDEHLVKNGSSKQQVLQYEILD